MTESKKRSAQELNQVQSKKAKVSKPDQKLQKKAKWTKPTGKPVPGKGKFQKFQKGKGKPKQEFKTNADGKTDWNDVKAKKKELKAQRRKNKVKDLYELSVQAKQLYEQLKCKSTPNKAELCSQLHALMKGDCYTKLVHSHDIARVVQCLLKHSPAEIRREVSGALIPQIVVMATSKYAHFCVSRMLKYGTKEIRSQVVTALLSNIVKLTCHNLSNSIIDVAFNMHATPAEKNFMKQEMYSDLFRKEKSKKIAKLADTWEGSPELKDAILSRCKANLLRCANKNLVDNSLVHSVILEYLGECKETDLTEMIQAFSGLFAYLPSTREGAMAATKLYLHAQTKDRRAILKNVKEHVEKTCNHESGHLTMITIVNCTDDTVMLNKVIFAPMLSCVESIAASEWGRKVLEWIVAPEDTSFFHPQFIREVNEGLKFGKKDAEVRRKEIKDAICRPLCDKITANPRFWLRGGPTALLTSAILRACPAPEATYAALAEVVCDPAWEVTVSEPEVEEPEEKVQVPSIKIRKPKKNPLESEEAPKEVEKCSGIEHAGLHVALKKIIKQAREAFGAPVAEKLTKETAQEWTKKNRACFILLNLIENNPEEVTGLLKARIDKSLLKQQTHPASKILLKKL